MFKILLDVIGPAMLMLILSECRAGDERAEGCQEEQESSHD
jgi:hypothetical protein